METIHLYRGYNMLRQYSPGRLLWCALEHHEDRPYKPPTTLLEQAVSVFGDIFVAVMLVMLVAAPIGLVIEAVLQLLKWN